MPKSLLRSELYQFSQSISGAMSIGVMWGAIAGGLIGAGISLAIGLFYSSASVLIFIVIFGSGALGAAFGHVIAKLLSDDIMMLTEHVRAAEFQTSNSIPRAGKNLKAPTINSQRTLGASISKGPAYKQPVIETAVLLPYRSDTKIFELVVASAARNTDVSTPRLAGL